MANSDGDIVRLGDVLPEIIDMERLREVMRKEEDEND